MNPAAAVWVRSGGREIRNIVVARSVATKQSSLALVVLDYFAPLATTIPMLRSKLYSAGR